MMHRYWLKNLSAYLDNELSETKREKIELHLKNCTICQTSLSQWKKIQEIQSMEVLFQPEEQVWYFISRRLKSEPVKPLHIWEDDWFSRYLPNPITAIVTAALVLLIVLGIQPYLGPQQDTTPVTIEQYLSSSTDTSSNNGTDVVSVLFNQS
jgi:hypothetical protein